jgi:hypothetical protein
MKAGNQLPTSDLTQPGVLNAMPWDPLTEIDEYALDPDSLTCDIDLPVQNAGRLGEGFPANSLPTVGQTLQELIVSPVQTGRQCTLRMDFLNHAERVSTDVPSF